MNAKSRGPIGLIVGLIVDLLNVALNLAPNTKIAMNLALKLLGTRFETCSDNGPVSLDN